MNYIPEFMAKASNVIVDGYHECLRVKGKKCSCDPSRIDGCHAHVSAVARGLRAENLAFGGSQAAKDVLDERRRQVSGEGWTPKHDDQHRRGELALAAASYALNAVRSHHHEVRESLAAGVVPPEWPWSDEWWKPSSDRRDLVKAAALIIAEIERLDRATAKDAGGV